MSSLDRVDPATWNQHLAHAEELGFFKVAAAPSGPVGERGAMVRDWVAKGYAADMHWFGKGLEKRLDPSLIMPDVASVIVFSALYQKEACTLAGKKLARYACGDDYHDLLLKQLRTWCARFKTVHPGAETRPYVDTGPVLERHWAEQSGLGWIGKNGNLIEREAGSYLFLAAVLTNLKVPYGEEHDNFCGTCRACIDACPTAAIVSDGVVDSRKCISYLNIEHRGPFATGTPDFEDWLFGCDICQEVCPWVHKFSRVPQLEGLRPREDYGALNEDDLAEMEQDVFSRVFRKSPIKRTKLAGLKRNLRHLLGLGG